MKSKKRDSSTPTEHLYAGGDKVCSFEFPLGRELVKAGDRIKIRNERGWFRFYKVVHNVSLGVTWVDVTCATTGEWRSFYLERVKMVDRPKRSYRKRVINTDK
jgi:hypothetical protein